MSLKFGSTFLSEFNKFDTLKSSNDFLDDILVFCDYVSTILNDKNHQYYNEVCNWKIELFNEERHSLFPHQVIAVKSCLDEIVLSQSHDSGYCFLPTSAGKGHIIITLAGLAIGNFQIFHIINDSKPDFFDEHPEAFPVFVSLSLMYAKKIKKEEIKRAQVLVHDVAILEQIKGDAELLLGPEISYKVQFYSVQSLGNTKKRENLKYVIIDECHWGNASQEETIQSSLISHIKGTHGKAFGFTASPYENPNGKFQRTWSNNKVNADLDFNYFLDNDIIYNKLNLREVNLQNARVGYELGDEEVELTEKSEIIDFIVQNIHDVVLDPLDGPAICFFSPVIIPDIVGGMLSEKFNSRLRPYIRVLGSEDSKFIQDVKNKYGSEFIATEQTIADLKKGETIFLISQVKLLVGLNAPYLRYCFISPTNSKIKILQGIGRLMRPTTKVDRKTAVLYLASLSGKKMEISEGESESGGEKDPCGKCGLKICDCDCVSCGQPRNTECECPKAQYVTTSMTLSEAYDLPNKVFYKTEVGFKDFINETRVKDTNSVFIIGTRQIPKDKIDELDFKARKAELSAVRNICMVSYKNEIFKRDQNRCQGKRILGDIGCDRRQGEVSVQIHHMPPYEFIDLWNKLGKDGVIEWHSNPQNHKHLVLLCKDCHHEFHRIDHEKKKKAS